MESEGSQSYRQKVGKYSMLDARTLQILLSGFSQWLMGQQITDNSIREMWEELNNIATSWTLPWCISRNFNEFTFHLRRKKVASSLLRREYQDFINKNFLMDLPLHSWP